MTVVFLPRYLCTQASLINPFEPVDLGGRKVRCQLFPCETKAGAKKAVNKVRPARTAHTKDPAIRMRNDNVADNWIAHKQQLRVR